jgi:hypothetical protein
LDIKFWRSEMAPTRASFSWYLERISDKVQRIVTDEVSKGRRKEDVKVVLIGHSAGGWLARCVYFCRWYFFVFELKQCAVTRDEAINIKLLDQAFSQRMRAPFFIYLYKQSGSRLWYHASYSDFRQ